MIRIPKKDAFKIRKICGLQSINNTGNKHHRAYYLVENPDYLEVYKNLLDGEVSKGK